MRACEQTKATKINTAMLYVAEVTQHDKDECFLSI